MAHDLFGGRMAFVGDPPWHGLGRQVPADVGSHEMLVAAGLDWRVNKLPATGARVVSQPGGSVTYDRYFLQRDPVGEEGVGPVLGVVSAGYEVLQNVEAFRFFEPLLSSGNCRYEAAGALGNGERVWVQVALHDPIEVTQDDVVERYFLLSNSHDGRGALSLRFTPIRVVCKNTLNLAMRDGDSAHTIRHSRNMRDRMTKEQVRVILKLIGETFSQAANHFALLVHRAARPPEREAYLNALFPRTERQRLNEERPQRWDRVDDVLEDDRVTPQGTRDTFWGLYNAVTRVEDYRRSPQERGDEARLSRVWFGASADLKVRALQKAVELCGQAGT